MPRGGLWLYVTGTTMETGNPLTSFADGVWLSTEPVHFLGLRLTVNMVVLRLGNGGLLVFSPIALTPERRAAVEALGPVQHLYAPNLQHDRWIGEWAAAFPAAQVHAPAALSSRRPDLRVARTHGDALDPAFGHEVLERRIDGFRFDETVLVYRPAGALVVADLVHNIGRPPHGWTAFYTSRMGFYDRVAISRMLRWLAFSNRAAARRSVEWLIAQSCERLVVGHGAPLAEGGKAALASAYDWLGVGN